MNTPNVTCMVELPADFEAEANRLGYSLEKYVWLLAEDAIINQPDFINEVEQFPDDEQGSGPSRS